jgi:hypothetical protein
LKGAVHADSRGRLAWSALLLVALGTLGGGCARGPHRPQHRERFPARNADCRDPRRPRAFMYPAENRTDYGPDDPRADGCVLDVPDHLFCCPDVARPTDR